MPRRVFFKVAGKKKVKIHIEDYPRISTKSWTNKSFQFSNYWVVIGEMINLTMKDNAFADIHGIIVKFTAFYKIANKNYQPQYQIDSSTKKCDLSNSKYLSLSHKSNQFYALFLKNIFHI